MKSLEPAFDPTAFVPNCKNGILFLLSFFLLSASSAFSKPGADSTRKIRYSLSLRPYLSRTWIKDYGFNFGPYIDKAAFSYAFQVGGSFTISPKLRLFAGLGYNRFNEKQKLNSSELRVNDKSDPFYLELISDVTNLSFYNFLEVPIRLDINPSNSGKGFVFGFGSTQSYWLSARYQNTGGSLQKSEGTIKAPATRFFFAQEIQLGWIIPLASGWRADTRLFAMADLIQMKDIKISRLGLGLQLSLCMGK